MLATIRASAENCLVTVSGRITIDSSPDLRVILMQTLATTSCQKLVVDLTDVEYVDTSALAVLLEVLRAAHKSNKTFQLAGLGKHPRYLLEATHILHLFDKDANEQSNRPVTGGLL